MARPHSFRLGFFFFRFAQTNLIEENGRKGGREKDGTRKTPSRLSLLCLVLVKSNFYKNLYRFPCQWISNEDKCSMEILLELNFWKFFFFSKLRAFGWLLTLPEFCAFLLCIFTRLSRHWTNLWDMIPKSTFNPLPQGRFSYLFEKGLIDILFRKVKDTFLGKCLSNLQRACGPN